MKPIIIHVARQAIQRNAKNGTDEPAIIVRRGSRSSRHHTVEILGPSRFVSSPNKPPPLRRAAVGGNNLRGYCSMTLTVCLAFMAVGLILAGPVGAVAGGLLAVVVVLHDGGGPPGPRPA